MMLHIRGRAFARLVFSFLLSCFFVSGCSAQVCESEESCQIEEDIGIAQEAATAADIAWWKGLSQTTRNQVILNRAGQDLGKNVGIQCKPWVQQVVSQASKSVATVPPTCPDAYGWYWCPGGNAVGISMLIQNVKPGYIVQMNVKLQGGGTGPHTAIVYVVDANGIWWIDSNWVGPNKVGMHYQTFATFLNSVNIGGTYKYNVYYIGQ